MDTKNMVICGDSFNIGIGCDDLDTQPYGQLLAKHLSKPIINLAKGSSTNFSIYLQAKYAVEKLADEIDLVILSITSYDRVDWFPLDYNLNSEITNADVNYHQYPPYAPQSYQTDNGKLIQLKNPMEHDPDYTGGMFTENLHGVIDYWETYRSKDKECGYYARFKNEPTERIKTLYDYGISIHELRINRIQSIGLMSLAHQLLKRANINHLILTHEPDYYKKFIDDVNICEVNWGNLSLKYPESSMHTTKEGHIEVFNTVLKKMKINRWVGEE
jgi:hypothetical protein